MTTMMMTKRTNKRGFSLIELVIVVVIIGIIAAIAIPRMSRGATGANDSALAGNLAVLRKAIDLYQAEHDGTLPDEATIVAQLTLYSNAAGATQAAKATTHPFGPYLRAIPPMTVTNAFKGKTGIAAASGAEIGWIYTDADGKIRANTTTEADGAGTLYSAY